MHTIAAIAVALEEVQTPDFLAYAEQTLLNAQILAEEFRSLGYKLVTGGTENHMVILDFSAEEYDGAEVEQVLDRVGISVSKSLIPHDPRAAFRPSGLRIGMPAMTTRGVKQQDVKTIVHFIDRAINSREDQEALALLQQEIQEFAQQFPLPS